jgi:hypothetical protein
MHVFISGSDERTYGQSGFQRLAPLSAHYAESVSDNRGRPMTTRTCFILSGGTRSSK